MPKSPNLARPKSRRSAAASLGWGAAWVLGSGALIALGFAGDAAFLGWIAGRPARPWEPFAQVITHAGDWPALALAVGCALLLARAVRARRVMTLLWVMFAATLLAGAIVQPLRALTGRARPHPVKVGGWHGVRKDGEWIAGRHRYSAFPSAHTTVAAAFVTPLLVAGGWRWLPVWLLALAVGWTRLYLGAHHPSDVAAGLALGSGCGWLVARSPALRWRAWRLSSRWCGYGRQWPGRPCRAAALLGGSAGERSAALDVPHR